MNDRLLCGWRVRSAIDFPELPPWRGDDRWPEIEVRLGRIPERDPLGPEVECRDDGSLILAIPDIGGYLLGPAGDITVEPWTDLASADLRSYFYGSVLSLLCFRRDILPLHASSVVINGRAVLIAGHSGAGKSSLAAVLNRRGHALLTDDLCPLVWPFEDRPTVLPSVPRLRLCRDTLAHLGVGTGACEAVQHAPDKFSLLDGFGICQSPAPVAAIYHIGTYLEGGAERLEPIDGLAAIDAVRQSIHREHFAQALGFMPAAFAAACRFAAQVPARRLWRSGRLDGLERMAALIEAEEAAR